jgi:hypothetical protein
VTIKIITAIAAAEHGSGLYNLVHRYVLRAQYWAVFRSLQTYLKT